MGSAYIFTLQPTFTQGLVLGQVSILCLLVVILKYLFFDPATAQPYKATSYQPRFVREEDETASQSELGAHADVEATQVDSYRTKLRGGLPGADGDDVARKRVEEFANKFRPPGFLDPIKVHSIDLGVAAPRLSRARPRALNTPLAEPEIEVDMHYTDTISIAFSTSVLLNYPFPSFARLPISLTISLSLFSATVLLIPPQPHAPHPTLTIMLPSPHTDLVLDLKTTSLMGSRAKLADVPKLHELITHQIRRVLIEKGTFKIVLPGLSSVEEVKEDVRREHEPASSTGS
ncbi:hypothetical protein PHLGIDRAFT_283987 [Phlebiopsis gigantea 11061_1 CR5-6]|uniref:SMP-LTD domain-containing protein n=1 Tax=Phlebiopsis gigantea (strain 11061_1 CR5-6) TaxID=745531 RepID=A0A0C3NDP9_PHLG1|nr:hypothetical protein PHLGIDRAFT_283987 [Phlebiopsis gigantea 11061_1 CR5-6]